MKNQRLKRWIRNWLNDYDYDNEWSLAGPKEDIPESSTQSFDVEPLRLSIYRADGGFIIESKVYDKHKSQYNSRLHIVNHDQDLGSELSKIITMESLRV